MDRILIVDDEVAARETIRSLVDWERIGFHEPMLAGNGREALKLYEKNEFSHVFTDIEMPVMDGIELIREIRRYNPDQKIIIISCHESFQYAREAMKLGVSEYLLKDMMNEEEIYEILLRGKTPSVVDKIGNPKSQIMIQDVLVKIISEESISEQEMDRLSKKLMNAYGYGNCFMVVLGVDDTRDDKSQYHLLRKTDALQNQLEADGRFVQRIDKKMLMLLVAYPQCASTAETMNQVMSDVRQIRNIARESKIQSLTIGVSEQFQKAEQIDAHYAQALSACRMKIFRGNNKTIFYSALTQNSMGLKSEKLEGYLSQMENMIRQQDPDYGKVLKKIYRPNMQGGFVENNYLTYANWRIWNMLYQTRKDLTGKESPTQQILEQGVERLNQLENAAAMEEFLAGVIDMCFIDQAAAPGGNTGGVVEMAIAYIKSHIHEDMSLADVADALHVHKGYLCRIFKEKTQVSLGNYITELKIEEARNMLGNTNYKTYEIAEKMGYQSPQYFSMVFKKHTNMSPYEYRKSLMYKDV